MAAGDDLCAALLIATPIASKNAVKGEEDLLGHGGPSGHTAGLMSQAATLAAGVAGDAFRTGLLADCQAFITALDGRYGNSAPHPSGLSWATFGDPVGSAASLSAAAAVTAIELGRGHAFAGHVSGIIGTMASFIASNLADNASYGNALVSLVATLDARYSAGTTEEPLGVVGEGLRNALVRMVTQAVSVFCAVVEGANGHGGHLIAHSAEAVADALAAVNIDARVAEVMATLDARYGQGT